jgi:DNA-binding transcriptional LysR family regulator
VIVRGIAVGSCGDLEVVIYALPGEEPDERIHSIPLFREQMVLACRSSRPNFGDK